MLEFLSNLWCTVPPRPPFRSSSPRASPTGSVFMNPPFGGVGEVPPPPKDSFTDNSKNANRNARPISTPLATHFIDSATDKVGNNDAGSAATKDKGIDQNASTSLPKVFSATCIPKTSKRTKIDLPSHRINSQIQYMRDHALIGKFLGLWPTEKALQGWIASKRKPKGQVTLQLGPKGFLTAIFNCLEDRTHIFEGGPYFFNSAGLYLRD